MTRKKEVTVAKLQEMAYALVGENRYPEAFRERFLSLVHQLTGGGKIYEIYEEITRYGIYIEHLREAPREDKDHIFHNCFKKMLIDALLQPVFFEKQTEEERIDVEKEIGPQRVLLHKYINRVKYRIESPSLSNDLTRLHAMEEELIKIICPAAGAKRGIAGFSTKEYEALLWTWIMCPDFLRDIDGLEKAIKEIEIELIPIKFVKSAYLSIRYCLRKIF